MARYAKFFSVGGGGGLTNFIDGVCNATQATAFIEVIGTAADINFALKPKGTGAIIAGCPDATAIGGNARGQYAVDLQIIRATATQVASGDYSAILGGRNNSTNNLADTFIMGSSITANTACTSYVNNLNIFNTPTVDNSRHNKMLFYVKIFTIFACHPCTKVLLIFTVLFQFFQYFFQQFKKKFFS